MSVTNLSTPRDLLDYVVTPDVLEFSQHKLDLRRAFHSCISLLSLRDWVVAAHKGQHWNANGQKTIPDHGACLQRQLEDLEPAFKVVTAVANASKHMKRRTDLPGAEDTQFRRIGGGIGGGIGMPIGGGIVTPITVEIDGHAHDVLDCVTRVHAKWADLFCENSW